MYMYIVVVQSVLCTSELPVVFTLQGKRVGEQGNGRSQVEGCKSHDPHFL